MGTPYATDMWALGAITFHLLTKQFPFDCAFLAEWAIGNCSFPTQFLLDVRVSESGIDFIIQNMQIPPEKRLSIQAALTHEWFESLTGGVQAPNKTWDTSPSSSSKIGSARDDNSTLAMGDLIHTLSSNPREEPSIYNRGDTTTPSVGDSRPSLGSIPRTEPLIHGRDHQERITVQNSSDKKFRPCGTIELRRGTVRAMSFSLDGRVVFVTDKGHIALCQIERGPHVWLDLEPSQLPAGRNSPFATVALSPDGELIATGTESGVISVRSTSSGTVLKEAHFPNPPCGVLDCVFFLNGLAAAFLLPGGQIALFFSVDAQPFVRTDIRFLEVKAGDPSVRNMSGSFINDPLVLDDSFRIRDLRSFHGDKDQLVYMSGKRFWVHSGISHNGQDRSFEQTFSDTEVPVTHISSDGEFVTYYDPANKAICVYRAQEKRLIREISLAYIKRISLGNSIWNIWVEGIAISSKTKILAANIHYVFPMGPIQSANYHIILWSLETGQEISRIGYERWQFSLPILPMDFSPDGTYLLCNNHFGGKIRVWKYDKTKNLTFLDKVRKSITR